MLIEKIGDFGYIGSLISGIFFVSMFTVVPTSVILFDLAKHLNPLLVAIFAGVGAAIGDYLIFRFLKDKVFEEISPVFEKFGGSLLKKLFISPFFIWLVPFMGAFVIASPLPDELGITLLGLSKVKSWHFILITLLLNAVGIFIVITLSRSL